MTRREQETRRRRRARREALAKAELESILGGPMVDLHTPVIGGGDIEHPVRVKEEMERRLLRASWEVGVIGIHFARKCWVVKEEAERMPRDLTALLLAAGPMKVPTTHSTRPGTAPTTIPRVPGPDSPNLG